MFPPSIRPVRLLVVEDALAMRALVRAWLSEEEDLEVAGEATDAPSALQACAELRPDVVVMDLRLPGNDAPEILVRGLRDAAPGVRVLAYSGLPPEEARRAGADLHIFKASSPAPLYAAVRTLAARRAA